MSTQWPSYVSSRESRDRHSTALFPKIADCPDLTIAVSEISILAVLSSAVLVVVVVVVLARADRQCVDIYCFLSAICTCLDGTRGRIVIRSFAVHFVIP